MWDRAGHVQGLSQLHGRTLWGKKDGEETSSIDASGQHGFHGNSSSLFLLGVDATKRLVDIATTSWQGEGGVGGVVMGVDITTTLGRAGGREVTGGHRWRAGTVTCVTQPPLAPNLGLGVASHSAGNTGARQLGTFYL